MKGYAAPMAPKGGTNKTGGGGGRMKMPRDTAPRSSSAFKKSGGGRSNFETGGGKRLVGRGKYR